jgi:glutamate N-acetyltransferase/amino-acid N-acetyltransferase
MLGCGAVEVAVCSTGLIGERLPMARLLGGVDKAGAVLSAAGGDAAAEAIRTTDTRAKQSVAHDHEVTVGGMAKGAAMLAPGLATMLAVITTDALADAATLDRVLRAATRVTFDRVDTDGCMSTNDTVLLLASGASGRQPTESELAGLVERVCADLAAQLVADAPSMVPIPTGVAFSPPSARPPRPLSPTGSTSRSTVSGCAVTVRSVRTAVSSI